MLNSTPTPFHPAQTPSTPTAGSVPAVRSAVADLAASLEDKAARLRAAVAAMESRGDLSPLEVMVILDVHDVRLTEQDLAMHRAVQESTSGLLA